jgi:hypothetical protein
VIVIELAHPTDPRYLLVREAPARVTLADLANWHFGKPLTVAPAPVNLVYAQPGGVGTDWVRP